ncbi:MAG: hypothetical protein JWR38_505 [Mucilaginibacter sp.]|nr:hypothetical protein [Mucilaginibacter sp.]
MRVYPGKSWDSFFKLKTMLPVNRGGKDICL